MGRSDIKGKDLRKINYTSDSTISLAMEVMKKAYKHESKKEKLKILEDVLLYSEQYKNHEVLGKLALAIIGKVKANSGTTYKLEAESQSFTIFGKKHIDTNTVNQMQTAMQLPVTVSGALMPDAHVGYGLPIGGVLATKEAVIPYAVGLDIGCRMALSLFKEPDNFLDRYSYQVKTALKEQTHFGIGKIAPHTTDHEVLERSEFRELDLLKPLHGKAQNQLGTSGSGNHFVEFGTVEIKEDNNLGIATGNYIGLLSHSGSRGLGATIASHYTKIAMDKCYLPKGAKHLAWLDINSEAGQEYWQAMNLAGDYAEACHQVIHHKLAKALGLKPILNIANHHNFAWKEIHNGQEVILHRKGATPAHKDQLGIIPASMADVGYIVSGKGNPNSLCSASHGAGRKMSRQKTKASVTGSTLRKHLKQHKITLIGGNTDEAPMAYKNLEEVLKSQTDLVDVQGSFKPSIVRMSKD